jgi:hypothetical protein
MRCKCYLLIISAKLFKVRAGMCIYQSVALKVFETLHKTIKKSELNLYAFENYFILFCHNFFTYFENKESG